MKSLKVSRSIKMAEECLKKFNYRRNGTETLEGRTNVLLTEMKLYNKDGQEILKEGNTTVKRSKTL